MKIRRIIRISFISIILLPVLGWLVWLLTPDKKLTIAIIDKTSTNSKVQEHISLNWVISHEKYSKTSTKSYSPQTDYFGFHGNYNKYDLHGLENMTSNQLEELSTLSDVTYYTDTYGVYNSEWNKGAPLKLSTGKLYGGMSDKDIHFLRLMKQKNKLIITEFNDIGSPTTSEIRAEFESLFGLHWSGWVARYFSNLDTSTNKNLPKWLIHNYIKQHTIGWPFLKSGLVFVNENDQIEILENGLDMNEEVPMIRTFEYGQQKLGLPHFMKYPYWLDIMSFDNKMNHAVSAYEINTNLKGKEILRKNGIPDRFPAVIMHNGADYRFYYFCGDFSDNPIAYNTSFFKGISAIDWLFYDYSKPDERKSFFWLYYRPMLTRILSNEYKLISSKK